MPYFGNLPEPPEMGEWVAYFYIYVDESGKLSNQINEFTSLCGYVAVAEEWHRVAHEWNALRFRWQVPPIHMSQIFSPMPKEQKWKDKRSEWGDLWEQKRDVMLAEFGQLMQNASVVCVGSVVDACAYRDAAGRAGHLLPTKDSNVFAFHNVIMRALEKIETVDKKSDVSIVVDDDPEHASAYYDLLQTLRQHPYENFHKVREHVQSLSFSQNPNFPGLQAADMIAWESRNYMRAKKANPDAEPTDLYLRLTHVGMNQPQLYSSEWIHKIARGTATRIKEANDENQNENREGLGI
jgi:hypothetical protein